MAQTQNRAIQFNGQRNDHNNWLINGGEAYDRGGGGILIVSPSQDSLQEFKVMTSNYAADLGQSSGGMITMATKSGTKQFHGGLWEYVRNDAFDANTFFSNLNGQHKPELRYNTFGGNIGGRFRSAIRGRPSSFTTRSGAGRSTGTRSMRPPFPPPRGAATSVTSCPPMAAPVAV